MSATPLSSIRKSCVVLLLFAILAGCSGRPVRHLTSGVSSLKQGVSTKEDVITSLGTPDQQEMTANGMERWLYIDRRKTFSQKLPFAGKSFGDEGKTVVLVVLHNGVVHDIEYRTFAPDEFGWIRSRQ